MRMGSEMIGILLSDSMHYTIAVSLEMSDEPSFTFYHSKCWMNQLKVRFFC